MAAYRYWRIGLIDSYGAGALELSALWLLAGAQRVDGDATLTSSRAPDAGELADLQGATPGAAVRWNSAAGLALTWDFGAAQEVTDIRLGAAGLFQTFAALARLEYSDDGSSWTSYATFNGIAWPGAWQLTRSRVRELTVDPVYTSAGGWDTANMTLFQDVSGASASVAGGVLQLAGVGSPGNVHARLDGCPPMADFEAVLFNIGGVRPALIFHTNYWSNVVSSIAWRLHFYYSQSYLNRGTGTDTGSLVQPVYGTGTSGTVCIRVVGGKLSVYDGSTSVGTTVMLTYTLDAFTGAGQFALGASGGAATFGAMKISPVYPQAAYIDCAGGIGHAVPLPGRAPSAAALPPLRPRRLQRPERARANYALGVGNAQQNQTGRIRGTVRHRDAPGDTPVRRRVRLFRWRDGLLVGEQWSDAATGAYDFEWVEFDQVYTVIADDYAGNWRAVIADQLQLEPMT